MREEPEEMFSAALNGESDDSLLKRFAEKSDYESLTVLIQRYTALVRLRARRYAIDTLDAEDLFQEGMIALLKAIRNYKPGSDAAFKTFAAVCINNKLRNVLSSHLSQKNVPMLGYVSFDEGYENQDTLCDDPVQTLISQEETDSRLRRIETLLSVFEMQVMQCYLQGLSYEKMAVALHSSTKAVDNALQRIRRKLRAHFTKE